MVVKTQPQLNRSFLGAVAKNKTECWSFYYGIWSFPTDFSNYLKNSTVFEVKFVVSLKMGAKN
jgi:hypothetical protein